MRAGLDCGPMVVGCVVPRGCGMRTRPQVRSGRGAAAALIGIFSLVFLPAWGTALLAAAPKPEQSTETLALSGLESQFTQIAQRVSSTVVAISAACSALASDDGNRSEDLNAQKLQKILGRTTRTVGTGFFIDADGYI